MSHEYYCRLMMFADAPDRGAAAYLVNKCIVAFLMR